ncbi:serine peptidase [Streptomyces sp. NBC_01550]|uniref:serine peptidase n=1 Tax=Streptomyces sp. NBC_01550 TaxID=2975875 RepID=UPI00386621ED
MSLIVGVHGVGNYVPGYPLEEIAAQRAALWATSLATGLGSSLENDDVAFAYYAHHLRRNLPVAQGPDDDALDHLTPDETALVTHWLEALDLPESTAQGRLTMPLRHAVAIVAKRFSLDGKLTRAFIALCFREVAAYLSAPDAPARHAAREEVASAIATHQPRVVIAHSLGTVVTYEALHAHPELTIDLLITLGSPLAMPHGVFHRLLPAPINGQATRPPGVARWVNVTDHGDPVAILRPLKQYFPDIDLDLQDSIDLFDFHRAASYLRSPVVAATLAPYFPRH